MSPRAFQTILVAPTMGNKDRLELESKVLAAALKQSFERGDTVGVSLAHRQIFLLLKAQQSAEGEPDGKDADSKETGRKSKNVEPAGRSGDAPPAEATAPPTSRKKNKKRTMPNIVWTEDEDPAPAPERAETKGPVESKVNENVEAAQDAGTIDASPEPDSAIEMAERSQESEADDEKSDAAAESLEEQQLEDIERPTFNAYGILAVDQSATFEDIHRSFLYLVRKVLISLKKAKRKQRRPLLEHLQDLWIAHDILSDPVTRTDFDFRLLGLRGSPDVLISSSTPEEKDEAAANSTRTPLRIGELMQCAGLLEQQELEIAADMHKAMPEMLFGAFLVKQGFISEEDLGQVLIGQWLLKNGDMSVNHYQALMKRWREDHTPIEESAVADGVVSQGEMDRLVYSFNQDTSSQVPVLGLRQPQINAEEAAKRNLSIGHAVPQWKDQLDWSAPPEPVKQFEERADHERKPMDPTIEIEGITDGGPKESSGKKSLRRLMEGIHSPDAGKEENSARTLKSILESASEAPEPTTAAEAALSASSANLTPVSPPSVTSEHVSFVTSEHRAFSTSEHQAFTTSEHQAFTTGENQAAADKPQQDVTSEPGIVPVPEGMPPLDASSDHDQGTPDPEVAPHAVSDRSLPENSGQDAAPATPAAPRQVRLTWDPDVMDESEETSEAAALDITEISQSIVIEAGASNAESHSSSPTREIPRQFVSKKEPYRSFDPGGPPPDQSEEFTSSGRDVDPSEVFGELNYDDDEEMQDIDYFGYASESPVVPDAQPVSSVPSPVVAPESPAQEPQPEDESEPSRDEQPVTPIDLVYFQEDDERDKKKKKVANTQIELPRPEPPKLEPPRVEPPVPESGKADAEAEMEKPETAKRESTKATQEIARSNRSETIDIVRPLAGSDLDTAGDDMDLSMFKPKIKPVPPPIKSDQRGLPMDSSGEFASFKPKNEPAEARAEVQKSEEVETSTSLDRLPDSTDTEEAPPDKSPGKARASKITTEVEVDALRIDAEVGSFEAEIKSLDEAIGDVETDISTSLAGLGINVDRSSESKPDENNQPSAEEPAPEESASKPVQKRDGLKKNDKGKNDEQRLKSGEWQLVYKLEGSIADLFLSEDEEEDIPQKLRPRLTEIDTIIPSSISKLAKDDTKSGGTVKPESGSTEEKNEYDDDDD